MAHKRSESVNYARDRSWSLHRIIFLEWGGGGGGGERNFHNWYNLLYTDRVSSFTWRECEKAPFRSDPPSFHVDKRTIDCELMESPEEISRPSQMSDVKRIVV